MFQNVLSLCWVSFNLCLFSKHDFVSGVGRILQVLSFCFWFLLNKCIAYIIKLVLFADLAAFVWFIFAFYGTDFEIYI